MGWTDLEKKDYSKEVVVAVNVGSKVTRERHGKKVDVIWPDGRVDKCRSCREAGAKVGISHVAVTRCLSGDALHKASGVRFTWGFDR